MSDIRMPKFFWWIGVVEDRLDPEFLGRYRVRILGYHTGNKETLPTEDLPWAVPVLPANSGSMSGVGVSGGGLVEGSTVIGFFADGEDGQSPLIFGTFQTNPQVDYNGNDPEAAAVDSAKTSEMVAELTKQVQELEEIIRQQARENKPTESYEAERDLLKQQIDALNGVGDTLGFTDPRKIFPRTPTGTGYNTIKEPNSSRLSRGPDAELHASLINKRTTRLGEEDTAIPMATAASVESVLDDKEDVPYERPFWEEPHPRFGWDKKSYCPHGTKPTSEHMKFSESSLYPYNRVLETETGHIFEVDDTPDNGRIHEYHNSGTFYEIQPDGKKVTKVVGDDYDITIRDKKVFIGGSCSVTIEGDASVYVKGNSYEEVDGDKFVSVKGDHVTKVGGNQVLEVLTDSNSQINGSKGYRVSGDDSETIVGNQTHSVAGTKMTTVNGNVTEKYLSEVKVTVGKSYAQLVAEKWNVGSGKNMGLGSAEKVNIKSKLEMEIESESTQLVKSAEEQTITALATQVFNVGTTQTMTMGADEVPADEEAGTPAEPAVPGEQIIEVKGDEGTTIKNDVRIEGATHSVGDVSTDEGNAPTLAEHQHYYITSSSVPVDTSVPDEPHPE